MKAEGARVRLSLRGAAPDSARRSAAPGSSENHRHLCPAAPRFPCHMTPPGEPSAAALARRPILTPRAALLAILLTLAVSILGIEVACVRGLGAYAAPSLLVAVFFVAYDLATGLVLLWAAHTRLAADRAARAHDHATLPERAPAASVLIAAYNEA